MTQYSPETMPLNWHHARILVTASMGQVLGTSLATLVGIVIPLMQLLRTEPLASWEQGALACVSLLGITVGSVVFGRLSDRYGYLFFFRFCPLLAAAAALSVWYFDSLTIFIPALFLMGFAVGGGYSLDSNYISETMPEKWKGFMVGLAKAFCAFGNIVTAALCFWILNKEPNPALWNSLWWIVICLAFFMFVSRLSFAESPAWLMAQGRSEEAQEAARKLLGDAVIFPVAVAKGEEIPAETQKPAFFTEENLPKIILCGIPWACEGLGVYGIGIFLPTLLMALGLDQRLFGAATDVSAMTRIVDSVGLTALISLAILPGFLLGLYLIRKWSLVCVQTLGFLACGGGLLLLLASEAGHFSVWFAVAGFMLFEIFLNAGPHLVTFVLPSEVYPVQDRGAGAGFAAACGKLGAVAAVFSIPILLEAGGMQLVLWVTVAVQILGAWVTWFYGRKLSRVP